MIEGLHFDFSSEELCDHLRKKVEHHSDRSLFYAEKAEALEGGGAEAAKFSGGDPVRALRSKATDHNQKAEMFDVLLKHIVPNETYRLTESDLIQLELISRVAW